MSALEKVRILVVDDNWDMRALLRGLLVTEGIRHIQEAQDGASGLDLLTGNECDLVLTDLAMTPMDGLEFTRKLRAEARNPAIPVIMISGHTEKHRVEAARDAGVTEFLVKPVTPRNLIGRIKDILERPRTFVRAQDFFGPNRRRRALAQYLGPFRRDADKR